MAQVLTNSSTRNHDAYAAKPWLQHYPQGLPRELDIPDLTVPDLLRTSMRDFPKNVAYTYFGRQLTFKEVDELSNQFAHFLISRGLQRGDRVVFFLANLPQFPIAYYGTLKAGGVVAAMSPLLVGREIESLVKDSGANIVVTLDRVWKHVEPLMADGTLRTAIVTGPHDELQTIKRMLYPIKFRKELTEVEIDNAAGIFAWRKSFNGMPKSAPKVSLDPADTAAFLYTGGTTGLPKAAVLTHRNLVANAIQIRNWIPDVQLGRESILSILPFFHSYGLSLSLNLAAYIGATAILIPRFDIADVMEQIAKYQPTLLPGVPTLYNAINNATDKDAARRESMQSIRYAISGGAPLPGKIVETFNAITGGNLVEGYGLTEASPVTHANPLDGTDRIGYIGLPLANTECRIVDIDTREPVPVGERGELVVRGPQIMSGYWNRPADTADVLDDDGWLYTGDIGLMEPDGFFKIVDRKKDIIISGGENVYPAEIEDVLYRHPKILEAAVIGIEHQVGGQIAKAFVVLKPGEEMTRRELLQFCNEQLAKYKVPRVVEFRDELPKSLTGKILRRVLAEQEANEPRRLRGAASSEAEQLARETNSDADPLS